jgi:tetratricopeptide (TPR) repeat protein
MYTKKIIFISTFIVVAIVLGYSAYIFWFAKPSYTNNTVNAVLMQTNPDFDSGKAYQKEGKYADALASYQKALVHAADSSQEGQIQYDIALMTEKGGNPVGAIPLFKGIVSNSSYYPLIRAYAAFEIGSIYTTYVNKSAIVAQTFTDMPYSSFLSSSHNDVSLAYRKLFEYAAGIYPLANAEVRIAYWYADDLRIAQHGATTTPEGVLTLSTIIQDLHSADQDIERVKTNPIESADLPDIYMREGLVYANLSAVGAAERSQAEVLYQKSLVATAAADMPVAFANFYYADFLLTQEGSTKLADIQRILAVYATTSASKLHPAVPTLFAAARTDTSSSSLAMKISMVRLANIDPSFKTYLESLGWHANDFSSGK